MTPMQIAKVAKEKLGCMPDITIECTGAEPCIQVIFHVRSYFCQKTGLVKKRFFEKVFYFLCWKISQIMLFG